MSKYHKKIIEVDAYQLGHGQMPAWFMKAVDEGRIELWPAWTKSPNSRVKTRTDWAEAQRSNYIVLNHRGELQVWNSYEFEKIFEPVEELHPNAKLAVQLDSAEQVLAVARYHLQDPIDSSDIRAIIKDIEAYEKAFKRAIPVQSKPIVETKNALYTEGGEFGTSISITSEFKGMFSLAQMDAYIESLTRIRDNIRKKSSAEV